MFKIIIINDSGVDNDDVKYYCVEYDDDNGSSGVDDDEYDDNDNDWC